MPPVQTFQIQQAPGQPGQQQVVQAPSVWQKMQMGAMMGVGVGLSIGLIGGVVQIARAGPGPKGAMHTLGQFMATSGATFGFFLSIGSVIRNEESGMTLAEEVRWRQASQQGNIKMLLEQRRRAMSPST